MLKHSRKSPGPSPPVSLDRPALIISLDSEQIWGHLDFYNEKEFGAQYPHTPAAYERLLRTLSSANVSATWLVVGGLALRGSRGPADPRMQGLPPDWIRFIPEGNEVTAPLWYRHAFIRQLAAASTKQEIGLHGGLTHLIWTDDHSRLEVARAEIKAGLDVFEELGIRPRSFSFPRNQERYHQILAEHGIQAYRGRAQILSEKFGRTLPGSLIRVADELGRATPPPVWPTERMPGLWNIPASLFLYPIGPKRARWVPLDSRIERVKRGIQAAIKHRAIFHFCLHPANLAENPQGFALFETILKEFVTAKEKGDADIVTMAGLAEQLEMATERMGVRKGHVPSNIPSTVPSPAMLPITQASSSNEAS